MELVHTSEYIVFIRQHMQLLLLIIIIISVSFSLSFQVKPCASSLNSNDAFVLKSPDSLFVWRGVGASEEEVTGAKFVVSFLGGKPTDVAEGKEPGQD